MRVVRTLIILLITLPLLCLLVPAAGAIYIEGQQIPDDGLPHILAAEENAAARSGDVSPADGIVSFPFAGFGGLSGGFPAALEPWSLTAAMPVMNNGVDTGSVIGHIVSSPSVWNRTMFDLLYVKMNMPLLSDRFFR
jgi:hypothetical protein